METKKNISKLKAGLLGGLIGVLIAVTILIYFTLTPILFYTNLLMTMNEITESECVSTYAYGVYEIYDKKTSQISYSVAEEYLMKIQEDPITIYKYDSRKTNDATVIYQEEGQYYQYTLYEDGSKTTPEVSTIAQDLGLDTDSNKISLDLGFKLKNLKKQEDKYIVSGTLNEVFERGSQIDELMRAYPDLSYEQFKVLIEIEITDIIIITIQVKYEDEEKTIYYEQYASYKKGNFEEYLWEVNDRFPQEEPQPTDKIKLNEEIETTDESKYSFKIDLTPGQYLIEASDILETFFMCTNENFNLLDEIIYSEMINKYIFTVTEEDTYKIKIKTFYGSFDYYLKFKITKLNYEDNYMEEKVLQTGSYNVNIEGDYDFIKYVVNVDKPTVLSIKNTSKKSFKVIHYKDYFSTLPREVEDYINLPLEIGKNEIYFTSADGITNSLNYTFDVEIVSIEYESEFDKLPQLTTEYSDYYYIGANLPKLYFKLTITEQSKVSFSTKNTSNKIKTDRYIYIYDKETMTKQDVSSGYIELQPGEYIVQLEGYQSTVNCLGIKYYFI